MRKCLFSVFVILMGAVTSDVALAFGGNSCKYVFGRVKLTPDATCNVVAEHAVLGIAPAPTFLGALGQPDACFTVKIRGALRGNGFAGLTSEPIIPLGPTPPGATPGLLAEAGSLPLQNPPFATRQILTARSVISIGGDLIGTADVILLGGGARGNGQDFVTEQLISTVGTGDLADTKANLTVLGNSIGQWASYIGRLCQGSGS